ncbi:tetratricopeptide repeat protein [Microbulbifer litoralis]|uniref:tetratricopeptide repeat protein n=1 Tax=Microbulbifer litoralis TaxID=2933965 RepID=UPI0020278FD4
MRNSVIGIALAGAMAAISQAPLAGERMAGGVEAFRSGDYQRALTLFERAESEGDDSAGLQYNIGVTLMKLGRYDSASGRFQRLLADPGWGDLARYNLALAAERRNRDIVAARYYRRISEASDSGKLRKLARNRLNALADVHRDPPGRRWIATANLSAGYDDNAYALQSELIENDSAGADNFTELFAWGQYQLRGTAEDGWRVHGYGFGRRYGEFDSLDLTSASAALARDRQWRGWSTETGVAGEIVYLGGEQVSRQVQLTGRIEREFGDASISLSYIPSYYLGGHDYTHLDGWRQRFEAQWQRPLPMVDARAYYRYDSNDRADLARDALDGDTLDYYSYSPVRHSFGGVLEWSPSANWLLSSGMEFRHSAYDGINRVTDSDGSAMTYRRESDRVKSWLSTRYRITPRFSLNGKIVVIDNDENRDLYTYDKTEASLGVSYIF